MRRSTIIGAVLAGGLALAGCSPNEVDSEMPPAPGTPPPSAAQQLPIPVESPEEFTATDREFAQDLRNVQQQMVELSLLAERNAQSAELKQVAGRIHQAAGSRVSALNAWLTTVASQQSGSAPEEEGTPPAGTEGVLPEQQVQQLQTTNGAAFDQQWKQAMLTLQTNSFQLAQAELDEGTSDQMRTLAQELVGQQQGTIADLNALP